MAMKSDIMKRLPSQEKESDEATDELDSSDSMFNNPATQDTIDADQNKDGENFEPNTDPSDSKRKRQKETVEDSKTRKKRRVLFELQELPPSRSSFRLQEKALNRIRKNPQSEEDVQIQLALQEIDEVEEAIDAVAKSSGKGLPIRKMNGGLKNLGNTCYMNAIIQALFALPVFITSIRSFAAKMEENGNPINQQSLIGVIQELFSANDPEARDEVISKLREIVIADHEQFNNFEMHDAQEFLLVLIEMLRTQIRQISRDSIPCPITENFEIELEYQRTCQICQKSSKRTDKEMSLSMFVPETPSSVQSCVSNHFTPLEIEKHCEECKRNTPHEQRTRIEKTPRAMMVHFQRLLTHWDNEKKELICKKKQTPIDLSTSVSLQYVISDDCRKYSDNPKLNSDELALAKESIEKLKTWETKKPVSVASGIDIERSSIFKKLGPRAVKQLTEEQQLKLAMAKSLEPDEDEDSGEQLSQLSLDTEDDVNISYLKKEDVDLLNLNSKLTVAQEALLPQSYSLMSTINHHGTEANSGHYTADVLNACSLKWTSFSDSRVRTIQEKTVLGRVNLIYILFYLKKDVASQLQDT